MDSRLAPSLFRPFTWMKPPVCPCMRRSKCPATSTTRQNVLDLFCRLAGYPCVHATLLACRTARRERLSFSFLSSFLSGMYMLVAGVLCILIQKSPEEKLVRHSLTNCYFSARLALPPVSPGWKADSRPASLSTGVDTVPSFLRSIHIHGL